MDDDAGGGGVAGAGLNGSGADGSGADGPEPGTVRGVRPREQPVSRAELVLFPRARRTGGGDAAVPAAGRAGRGGLRDRVARATRHPAVAATAEVAVPVLASAAVALVSGAVRDRLAARAGTDLPAALPGRRAAQRARAAARSGAVPADAPSAGAVDVGQDTYVTVRRALSVGYREGLGPVVVERVDGVRRVVRRRG